MTSVGHITDQGTKWMRFMAWALTLMWASFWTPLLVARIFLDLLFSARPIQEDPKALLIQAFLFLSLWVSTVLPWRWEAIGGVVLALESLAFFIWLPVEVPNAIAKTMPVLLFGLAAGILFLASWWKSRRPGTSSAQGEKIRGQNVT